MNTHAPELPITVTATFTAEPIREAISFWMNKLQRATALHFLPLNQVFQQLLDPSSPVRQNAGVNLVLIRFDDWCRVEDGFETDIKTDLMVREKIQRNVDDLSAALKAAAAGSAAPYIVCLCPMSPLLKTDPRYDFADIEARLCEALSTIDGLHTITAQDVEQLYPVEDYYDFHADKLGHIPYKQVYFDALAAVIARKIRAIKSEPYKVIVLDCDQTLWKGVCGEDGMAGISLDLGRKYLQDFMLGQHANGMLLCLCSKNNESDVWAAFEALPGMQLGKSHIVSHRINWQSKGGNIRALADELQLSLDSFIFVDDNPLECAEVSATCPGVLTLCLPQNGDDIPAYLDHVWAFDRLKTTAEDKTRTEMYRQNAQRESYKQATDSFEAFLRGLEMTVQVRPLTSETLPRAAQLSQRVNQFNVSAIRYSENELAMLSTDPRSACFTVEVKDRFGDYGLVGLLVCQLGQRELKLVNMLLSCRALGKGVEHRMLAAAGEFAQSKGIEQVRIEHVPTDKNKPAQAFLLQVAGQYQTEDQGKRFFTIPAQVAASVDFMNHLTSESAETATVEDGDATVTEPAFFRLKEVFDEIARELNTPRKITAAVLASAQARVSGSLQDVEPRNDVEATVAAIWREVLDLQKVGVTDNFFALGGESIKAVQILSRMREEFAVDLPMTVLFGDTITVESLSQAVETALLSNVDDEALAAELAAIENMSEEEIERLLQQAD